MSLSIWLDLIVIFTETVEEAAPVEEGYSYPVPENPLELPEKHSQLADDSVAPLALYGAPAQPFELPPGKWTQYATRVHWENLVSAPLGVLCNFTAFPKKSETNDMSLESPIIDPLESVEKLGVAWPWGWLRPLKKQDWKNFSVLDCRVGLFLAF